MKEITKKRGETRDVWAPTRIGWIVDAQKDFVKPPEQGGRLYVHDLGDATDPGAQLVVGAIARTVEWMVKEQMPIILTGDMHAPGDPEIDLVSPDPAKGTYPPHCMGYSRDAKEREGAEICDEVINALGQRTENGIEHLQSKASAGEAVYAAERALRGIPLFVEKTKFSVWEGNKGMYDLASTLARQINGQVEFVIAGVATDVCVKQAVDGFRHGLYQVVVIKDAVHGLGIEKDDELFDQWRRQGVRVMTLADLQKEARSTARHSKRRAMKGPGR
jgi:nicotinamidase-related amidase